MIGTITDQYRYGPYGELANQTGTTNTPFHYNGRDGVMTDDNGLYYMRARYYNPEVKRFINMDVLIGSINEGQSTNRFIYVYGNPVMVVDPLGLSGLWGSNGLWGDRSLSQNLKDTAHYLKSDEAKEAYKNTAIVAGATYGTLTGITFAPEIAAGASTTASIAAPKVAEIASKASSKIVSIAQNGEKYAQIAYQKVDLWIWAHTREILTTQKYIMDLNPKAGTPPETMLGALIGFIQANVPEAYEPQSPKPLPGTHLSSSPANTRCR
ncbi:MAG: RHS repeat-associated core domain-containing protein [Methylocystaceae bacterium]